MIEIMEVFIYRNQQVFRERIVRHLEILKHAIAITPVERMARGNKLIMMS